MSKFNTHPSIKHNLFDMESQILKITQRYLLKFIDRNVCTKALHSLHLMMYMFY